MNYNVKMNKKINLKKNKKQIYNMRLTELHAMRL